MKKFMTVFLLLTISLCLNACTLNWIENGKQVHYSIPWISGISILIFLIAIVMTFFLRSSTEKYFFCPKCNHRFKPKWYRASGTIRGGSLLRCPKCHKKSFMLPSYDQTTNEENTSVEESSTIEE